MVKLPVADGDGFPVQTRGMTAYPGLFFVGLPWLHTAKSGLIYGLSEDARYIADRVAARREAAEGHEGARFPSKTASLEQARSRTTRTWADRVMTLIWSSALSLMLDGFATSTTGTDPTIPHAARQTADSAIPSRDASSGRQ
jgi:putative flavoprotein involved in K+ transport